MRKSSDDKFLPDEFGVEGPAWADGKIINEAIFCEEFLSKHKILFSGGSFFTTEGRVVDETSLKRMVFDDLKICAVANVPQKISNMVHIRQLRTKIEDDPQNPVYIKNVWGKGYRYEEDKTIR